MISQTSLVRWSADDMGILGGIIKVGAKGLGKKVAKVKGDSPYWDPAYTATHTPHLVVKAAKGMHKAYSHVKDAPKPWHPTEYLTNRAAKIVAKSKSPIEVPYLNAKVEASELAKSHGVHGEYLEHIIGQVHDKESLKLVREYVQSKTAENLTPFERTDLIIKCAEKLKYIDVVRQFFT